MKGKENPESEFDLVEIVEVTPAEQVTYAPDHPQFAGGDLGTCNSRRLIVKRSVPADFRLRTLSKAQADSDVAIARAGTGQRHNSGVTFFQVGWPMDAITSCKF